MVLHGDGSQAMNIDSSALSKRPLPTRAYLFHKAPHLCGVPGGVPGEWADVCVHKTALF